MQRPLLTGADRTSGLRSIFFTDPHVAQSQNSVLPLKSKAGIGSIVFQLKEGFRFEPDLVSSSPKAWQVVPPATEAQSLSHR